MKSVQALFILLLLLIASHAAAASGIKGRVAWQGELVPEVKVRAYRSLAEVAADRPLAVSAPTAIDGTYRLELPPGAYYLVARDYDGARPQPGKHFCYYSGAPVQVVENAFTHVGFNLIRIPEEAAPEQGSVSGVRGQITFEGEPLEKVYLYVYKAPVDGFKGPGHFIQPVEKGSFRLRLPPGEYFLLARKRAKGGQFGPIEIGDYFNYYHGNPLRIEAGQMRQVRIETITRLSMLEEEDAPPPFRGVRGRVLGPGKKPLAGLHVFAYRDPAMTGSPDFFSPPTAADGTFALPLPAAGDYYLLAREAFGGPAAPGELYGKYRAGAPFVTLSPAQPVLEVTIDVAQKSP
jgi:hypothetical protein